MVYFNPSRDIYQSNIYIYLLEASLSLNGPSWVYNGIINPNTHFYNILIIFRNTFISYYILLNCLEFLRRFIILFIKLLIIFSVIQASTWEKINYANGVHLKLRSDNSQFFNEMDNFATINIKSNNGKIEFYIDWGAYISNEGHYVKYKIYDDKARDYIIDDWWQEAACNISADRNTSIFFRTSILVNKLKDSHSAIFSVLPVGSEQVTFEFNTEGLNDILKSIENVDRFKKLDSWVSRQETVTYLLILVQALLLFSLY